VPWYYDLSVTCLTPGARDAIAVTVDDVGDTVWSVEVAEVDLGMGEAPWSTGVHLFSAKLLAPAAIGPARSPPWWRGVGRMRGD